MARFFKNKKAAIGHIPGEPVFIGEKKMDKPGIHIFEYNTALAHEQTPDIKDADGISINKEKITWININGLHDVDLIRSVGSHFSIHPLVLEDILNTGQRPRFEEYDDHLYIVTKMMRIDKEAHEVRSEQLSMILKEDLVITFQERPGDVFEPIRDRIRNQKGRIRNRGADYLAYSLLDCIVDQYSVIIEYFGDEIEDMENEIRINPDRTVLQKINDQKQEINYLRKTLRPAKECIANFARWDSEIIEDQTRPFIKDLLENITQALEITDTYRDMLSDHLDIYNTGVNNRLNEIMKVLTIFSAIFIPLTFIAGIYGTNFDFLPELHFKYSYPIFWAVLLLIAGIMIRFFRKRKWL